MVNPIKFKHLQRQYLKLKRAALTPQRRQEAQEAATIYLEQLVVSTPYVLSFAHFDTEINLWPFNQKLAQKGQLVLPRIEKNDLRLYAITHLQDLCYNQWNIPEPPPGSKEIQPSHISIAFIPGLGFDFETKHRLGYGKGYYDRLLQHVQAPCWGVGFLEQHISNIAFTSSDIPLTGHLLF